MVFVFGSNEAGVHGGGAAKTAYQNQGAVWGKGVGRFGNSYALPTKDASIETLPLPEIHVYVSKFLEYAEDHPDEMFQVTRIGCGLAGLTDEQIAPMFAGAPSNCLFDSKWSKWLPDYPVWGTF
jgi:hypothetical protein